MPRKQSRSRAEWRKIIENLETSDLTQKEYAKQVGCHPWAFGWWRKRFAKLEENMPEISAVAASQPAFVELRVAEHRKSKAASPPVVLLRIDGAAGLKATFETLPPADYLAALLRGP